MCQREAKARRRAEAWDSHVQTACESDGRSFHSVAVRVGQCRSESGRAGSHHALWDWPATAAHQLEWGSPPTDWRQVLAFLGTRVKGKPPGSLNKALLGHRSSASKGQRQVYIRKVL